MTLLTLQSNNEQAKEKCASTPFALCAQDLTQTDNIAFAHATMILGKMVRSPGIGLSLGRTAEISNVVGFHRDDGTMLHPVIHLQVLKKRTVLFED